MKDTGYQFAGLSSVAKQLLQITKLETGNWEPEQDSNQKTKIYRTFCSTMLIRIVRMHFTEAGVGEFLEIFEKNKIAIRNFPGCSHLQLLKEADDPLCYSTLSHWNDPADLEKYRKSELFGSVWGRVKTLFSERTQAFSLEKFIEL